MPCDIPVVDHGVVPRPCTDEVKDRNWDEVIEALDKLKARDEALQACVTSGAVEQVGTFPFKLTAALALGGTAAAVLRSRSAGAWVDGAAIVVKDAWNCGGKFWGRINDIGFAWQDPTTGEYVVIELQTIARSIRYTLDHTLSLNIVPGAANFTTATVNDYWNGCDPGATVTVYDPRRMFHGFHCKLCTGYAEWNERSARYEIRDPQLMSMFHRVSMVTGVCITPADPEADPPTVASIQDSGVGDILESYEQAYYSATPYDSADALISLNVDLDNRYKHVVAQNKEALVLAKLEDDEVVFQIVDVQKEVAATLDDEEPFSWSTGFCSLAANTLLTAVESCGDPANGDVPIPFSVVDVVDTFELVHGYSPDSCKIVAHTRQYCMIDHETDGADIDVAVMTEREVLTDWYLDYVAAVPPLTEYYAIKASTEKLWVPCYNSGTEVDIHHLLRRDIIDDFDTVHESSPESCKIIANTKQTWVFDLPDPAVAGDDITVAEMTKREVLIDLDINSTDLNQDTEYHWVLCYDTGTTVSVVGIDPCE